jgi:hypothetical protein
VAEGQTLEINAVSINSNLAGAAVPEPRALALVALGITILLRRRHR